VADNLALITATVVLGVHIQLRYRASRHLRDVLDLPQRSVLIEHLCRVEHADACEFFEDVFLLEFELLAHFPATQREVPLNLRTSVDFVDAAIDALHALRTVASLLVGLATVLIWVSKQMIAEATLFGS